MQYGRLHLVPQYLVHKWEGEGWAFLGQVGAHGGCAPEGPLAPPREKHYTVFLPMPRISALYPVAYTTDIHRRSISVVYATGYNADIRGMRHKYYICDIRARGYPQISVVYDPRILARNLAHSPSVNDDTSL